MFDFVRLSASRHRGLVLKRGQKELVSHLLEGKDVLGNCLVIGPLFSIIGELINSNKFDLEVKGFTSKDVFEYKITNSR